MKPYKNDGMWFYILFLSGIIFGIVASGCAGGYDYYEKWREVDEPADSDAAAFIVASEIGITHIPEIRWYGNGMDCAEGYGWMREGHCIDGVFWEWSDQIALSVRKNSPIHLTPLAHELCHAREYQLTGFSSQAHDGECFVNRLAAANEKLAAAGY